MKPGKLRFWVPFLLGALAFGAVGATLRDPGLTWDESIYFGFAQRYWVFAGELGRADWYTLPEMPDAIRQIYRDVPRPWGAFSQPVIYAFWRAGQAHPPLAPLCYAAGMGMNYSVLCGYLDAITAFRLPAVLIFTGLVLATYFFFSWAPPGEGAKTQERIWIGGIAAASLMLMPRVFGDAHFAALDMPITLMWLLTVAAFRKGMTSRPWAVASGIVFGLALLTKINAAFLPLVLWPWGLLVHRRKCLPALLATALIGPAVFVAGWPWLWHDTFAHVWSYLADKASRLHIAVYYLGATYDKYPPAWHYPFVLTAVTAPAGLLAAALAGLRQAARQWRTDPSCSLALMNLIVIYGVAAFPHVPKYDGVRLFLPAFPFIAGLAAMGILWGWKRLSEAWPKKRHVCYAAGAVFASVLAWDVASYHPYELSYYNGLVGGLRGAHQLGFETEYWGDIFNAKAIRAVNALCAQNASVCIRPLDIRIPTLLQAIGELREDLKFVSESAPCDYVVLLAREGYFSEEDWRLYREGHPIWESPLRGVPLCRIFENRRVQ